jgi:hypothetical protein
MMSGTRPSFSWSCHWVAEIMYPFVAGNKDHGATSFNFRQASDKIADQKTAISNVSILVTDWVGCGGKMKKHLVV